jgi:hypothetical protein
MIGLRRMGIAAALLTACDSSTTPVDASACGGVDNVRTAIAVPAVDPVTANLTVYGSVQAPPGIAVLDVFLSAVPRSSFSVRRLPAPAVAAMSDAGQFATWHATVPYAVMVAPLDTLPGQIELVAVPHLDCPFQADNDPDAIGISHALTIQRPPAVDAGAP